MPVYGLSSGVVDVSAGYIHTCALIRSGYVQCWGDNSYGQLGIGGVSKSLTPVSAMLNGATAVAVGGWHTCALLINGTVTCWGCNNAGQLGNGRYASSYTPVFVTGLSGDVVAAISAGREYTCVLLNSGDVKCWGINNFGQLGNGGKTDSNAPVSTMGLSGGVTGISAGYMHTCAVLSSGSVQCWGSNSYGQLGNGGTTDSNTPVFVTGLSAGATAIVVGLYHTCALLTGGNVQCWGLNFYGELGYDNGELGYDSSSTTPVSVTGLSGGVMAVYAGGHFTCVLMISKGVQCWGINYDGELGNGGVPVCCSNTPTDVTGLVVL